MRTNVYIDGFNLYYRLKDSRTKWLNPRQLCEQLLTRNEIGRIRYFTARVVGTPDDPQKQQRQLTLFRALRTVSGLTIHEGHFLSHEVEMPLADPSPGGPRTVTVVRTEEKGSDVHLATQLLCDGFDNEYEVAVVITNDSDQVPPIEVVRRRLKKRVVVLNPNPAKPSAELKHAANLVRDIRPGALRSSQFPPMLQDKDGTITMPALWDAFAWCEECRQAHEAEQWVKAIRACPGCRHRRGVAWSVIRLERPQYPEEPVPHTVYSR